MGVTMAESPRLEFFRVALQLLGPGRNLLIKFGFREKNLDQLVRVRAGRVTALAERVAVRVHLITGSSGNTCSSKH